MADRKIVHALISGTVQGVWFRAWTLQEAQARGLDGWVRNRRDGSVEALVHGKADAVHALIDWARRGPPGARVAEVRSVEASDEAGRDFEIRATN